MTKSKEYLISLTLHTEEQEITAQIPAGQFAKMAVTVAGHITVADGNVVDKRSAKEKLVAMVEWMLDHGIKPD